MRFEFSTVTKIVFGKGTLCEVGTQAAQLGSQALVVTGANSKRAVGLLNELNKNGIHHFTFPVTQEPLIETVRQGIEVAKQNACDIVIGFGGGSALDTAKAIAALLANPGDVLDYLEVIGKGKKLTQPSVPMIAIPTTAGTGTEVTRNAVLGSLEHGIKVSLRSELMLPCLAIVDPELTYNLPPAITASTGLDALTQLIEPFTSRKANPITDALCQEGIIHIAGSLKCAYDGENPAARKALSLAALFGGLALANAGLGAVHGLAGPLGGELALPHGTGAPHGALCARLLPFVMATNLQALKSRQPENPALSRYTKVGQLLTGNPRATSIDGITWLRELCAALDIQPLSAYGFTQDRIPNLVEKASRASSMKANPIVLMKEEMTKILEQAL